ncbi:MAG: family 43 glycosylhydrolase [Verrucomicrobia bacterium]|nr:family 43 glycosylhydrolase [Verrucomicrobiota bacterium]MCH8510709.1 glycoside hydrolase family 43 protein [Kiritimatiellia bacterium]
MNPQPTLRGFHPDPSWVHVNGWTYLVTSTFGWLPGLPVYRSRDLVQWEPLPPAIPDTRHLDYRGCGVDDGLYAPGIRHDGRRFLLACTLVRRKEQRFQNFICVSENPAQGWSAPVMLPEDLGRIDPTPFTDADGSLWIVLNDLPAAEHSHGATRSIRSWRLNPETLQPEEGPFVLWHGAMVGAATPEAPRLFQRDGWYWLLIAEGGTGRNHAVTLARSRSITGPYEGCPANPLLTHRHLDPTHPVQCVGHADLMQDNDGQWLACCLAERRVNGLTLMGRETWTLPVSWPPGQWPVFSPESGALRIHGEGASLDSNWIGLRTPPESLISAKGVLAARPHAWTDTQHAPALMGRRIREFTGSWSLILRPDQKGLSCGLAIFCTESAWLRLAWCGQELILENAKGQVFARETIPDTDQLDLELTWSPAGVRASWSTPEEGRTLDALVQLQEFAHPVFAGATACVWAQGEGGSLGFHPA